MPNTYTITITRGNTETHGLTLDDDGHTRAQAGDTIEWVLGDRTVTRIRAITNKRGSDTVFNAIPEILDEGRRARVVLDSGISKPCSVFIYSIVWIASDGSEHTFDPLISIKPRVGISIGTIIGPVIGGVVGAVASFVYWRKLREDLNRENEKLVERNKQLQLENDALKAGAGRTENQ